MDAFIQDHGFISWYENERANKLVTEDREKKRWLTKVAFGFRFETSAKEDINITKGIKTLVQHILDNDPEVLNSNKEISKNLAFLFSPTNIKIILQMGLNLLTSRSERKTERKIIAAASVK